MPSKALLLILLIITVLLCTVAVRVAYRGQVGEWLHKLDQTRWSPMAREAGAVCVMIGMPFLALITGAAGLNLLALGADLADPAAIAGFVFANWVRGVGVTITAVAAVLLVLWLGARAAEHGRPWRLGWMAMRDAIYSEVHWAFYRAAPVLWLADPYWGTVLGTSLVLVEWMVQPDFGLALHTTEGRQYFTLRLACLLCSSFLYLAVQNLWLMIVADLVLLLVGSRLLGGREAVVQSS